MLPPHPLQGAVIDHIGIAVKDIEATEAKYKALLGEGCFHREVVGNQKVEVGFIKVGDIKLELVKALNEESAIHRFIEKRGEGLHHLAYRVEDIYKALEILDEAGFRLIDKKPRHGAMNKLVAFIHPKEVDGVLIEVCQKMKQEDLG
jgi:methylmalonyl-CoA/ethylmalonyl-CoA epimerase